MALGVRQHSLNEATALIEAFLQEPFSNDECHNRPVNKITTNEHFVAIVE